MGTNYYAVFAPCSRCGLSKPSYHIGKSSGGWVFALHVDPDKNINNLDDIIKLCKSKTVSITNEYDNSVSLKELLSVIKDRSWNPERVYNDSWYKSEEDFLRQNHAVKGPNNLMRSKIDGEHCIGHGSGTWDLIIGEFS